MRVIIADDQALVRRALRLLLEARGHQVVAEVGCAEDTLEQAHFLAPDVVLLGLALPVAELSGLTRRLAGMLRCTNVVVLTDHEDEVALFDVIRAGARGYVTKDLDSDDFCTLLERAGRGESGLTPALAARVLEAFASAPGEPPARHRRLTELTGREREVLEHMTRGATSNRDLAASLGVTENTVRFHMRNILDKLHLHTRAAAVVYALTHGLLESSPTE